MRHQSSDFVSLFEPTIERVLQAKGADFLRELLHLVVEGWLRNGRVAPFVGDMVNESVRWGGGSSTGCAGSTTNCFGLSRKACCSRTRGLPRVFQHVDYRVYPQLVDLAAPGERSRDHARAKIAEIT